MPESQGAHLDILTDAEREALERPGLRQRSRALIAAAELSTTLGLSDDTLTAMLERLRGLDKNEAKAAAAALEVTNRLLADVALKQEVVVAHADDAIDVRITSDELLGSASDATQNEPGEVVSGQSRIDTEVDVPVVEPPEKSRRETRRAASEDITGEIAEALDSLIESHRGSESGYNVKRVQSVLDQLRKSGVVLDITAEDFSHGTLRQLALMYAAVARAEPQAIKTNIACTWGWLYDVEMADLRIWRGATKPDAAAIDVHNSRVSFIGGVAKGWKSGLRPDFSEVGDEDYESHEAEPEPLEPSDAEAAEAEIQERSIEEEPKYVQIVSAYIERLGLDMVNKRAFEELINPASKSEDTAGKKIAFETVRHRVALVSPDGSIFNDLEVNSRAKASLRRMFGLGFERSGGRSEERDPETIKQQLRHMDLHNHARYVQDFYSGLEALLDVLDTPVEALEQLPEKPKVLQIDFSGGEARLA